MRKVVVQKVTMPRAAGIDDDIDFICKSFGYFTERDKMDTAGEIFRIIVKKTSENEEGFCSDEIATLVGLSRGTIVHHLNNFIDTGLVVREHNKYRLRGPSLQKSIEDVKLDIERLFVSMIKIAAEIDEKLGYYYR